MKSIFRLLGPGLLGLALLGSTGAQPNFRKPPRAYLLRQVMGRTFRIEKTLNLRLGLQAALRMQQNFEAGLAHYPLHARPDLRSIKLYVMQGPDAPNGGRENGMAYFRRKEPSFRQETDPHWSHVIVCWCAQNYMDQTELWALKVVMHELAHAYHLNHYPEQEPQLMRAWEHAKASGLYRNVLDEKGQRLSEAYALTNQLEYFAELSVMYFGRCNYAPQDRAALRQYDPQGYAVIEKLWKVR